jgi:hypothetical protein
LLHAAFHAAREVRRNVGRPRQLVLTQTRTHASGLQHDSEGARHTTTI